MRRFLFALAAALTVLFSSSPAETATVTGINTLEGTAAIAPGEGIGGGDAVRISSEGNLTNFPPAPSTTPSLTTGAIIWTPQTPVTFANITSIQASFKGEEGRTGGGSPRFSFWFDWNGNDLLDPGFESDGASHLFALWGTDSLAFKDPFTGAWQTTPNFVGIADKSWEVGQIDAGGYPYTSYADMLSRASIQPGVTIGQLVGNLRVMQIGLVLDGGWNMTPGTAQEVLLDNVVIEGFTPDELGPASFSAAAEAPAGFHFFQEILAVPEPATALMVLFGVLALSRRRHRA